MIKFHVVPVSNFRITASNTHNRSHHIVAQTQMFYEIRRIVAVTAVHFHRPPLQER